jgi:hypothetical protein
LSSARDHSGEGRPGRRAVAGQTLRRSAGVSASLCAAASR